MSDGKNNNGDVVKLPRSWVVPLVAALLGAGVGGGGVSFVHRADVVTRAELAERDYVDEEKVRTMIRDASQLSEHRLTRIEGQLDTMQTKVDKIAQKLGAE